MKRNHILSKLQERVILEGVVIRELSSEAVHNSFQSLHDLTRLDTVS
jgi:hypothetical protein